MNATYRCTIISVSTLLLVTLCSGCPMSGGTVDLYCINVHSDLDLETVELLNQQTDEFDNLLSAPISPLGFEVLKVPVSVYGGAGGKIELTGDGFLVGRDILLDDTPWAAILSGTDPAIDGDVVEGGDSFSKLLAGGAGGLSQQ